MDSNGKYHIFYETDAAGAEILTWGLNDIFKKELKTVTFNMYPVYQNFGSGYAF